MYWFRKNRCAIAAPESMVFFKTKLPEAVLGRTIFGHKD